MRSWTKSDEFDRTIRAKFLGDYEAIVAGEREHWRGSPRGALAYIIVLDQFSRNMFRGTAKMFTADPLAREVCCEGLDAAFDRELAFDERVFFYLPLEHSEDAPDHERCHEEATQGPAVGGPRPLQNLLRSVLGSALWAPALVDLAGCFQNLRR